MLIGIDASRACRNEPTGTENYSRHLIRALLRQGTNHRFRLYSDREPAVGLFPPENHVEWRVIPFPRMWTHFRLSWELIRHPVDVLYVPAHVLPLVHPRRSVATVHDLGYMHFPAAHRPRSYLYLRWSTRFNARTSARVIVDSMATRDDLISLCGVAESRVAVAYPSGSEGMHPVTDRKALETVRTRYGTGRDYFLHVGTIHPRKNLRLLIDAFDHLVERGTLSPEVKLVLAGRRGWLYEETEALAHTAARGRVVLPGFVPAEDLAALYSGAISLVFPSLYEGFGLPLLEAMACDTPVICANGSSLPEVVGDAGLLVDPRDRDGLARAMERLYHEPDLADQLVDRGRQRLAAFSWDACAREVMATLELVGQGRWR